MDTDVLRWFKQVAEGSTVTEVSELEAVTQSGISRALGRLDEEVGTPLLRRSGRRLRLTRAGEVFKPYVDVVLHQLDAGLAAVGHYVSPETGTVRITFQQSLGTWLVPDLVRTFRAAHSAVEFHLTQVSDEPAAGPLDDGEADLEISTRLFADQPLVTLARRRTGVKNGCGTARDVVSFLARSRPRISLTPGTGFQGAVHCCVRARGLVSSVRPRFPGRYHLAG